MNSILHITSGDCAGDSLKRAGLPGEVFVWHDILYDGPRDPGWLDAATLEARARFLEQTTGGGLSREQVLATLQNQYDVLAGAADYERIVLWFDACLFDQSMLAHILTCLRHTGRTNADLLCVDAFPGIVPFHGLGQLQPAQLASLYDRRRPATEAQFDVAVLVDHAFATQEQALLTGLVQRAAAPLPWVPAAVTRWLEERPDPATGLGKLERLALSAIRSGCQKPRQVFAAVAAADEPPQYWGDTTLWAKVNALADRDPPLVRIDGPLARLPQWQSTVPLDSFTLRECR